MNPVLPLLGGAFLSGLLGSPHCIAMCGAFASACGRSRPGLAAWHLGRLTTYVLLGAAGGGVGAALPGPGWIAAVLAAVLLCWFAASLAGLVGEPRLPAALANRFGGLAATGRGLGSRLAFGLINGLLPCGLVYSALGLAIATGSVAAGALVMLAFGIGTTPALTLAVVALYRLGGLSLVGRRLLAATILAAGLWAIALRSGILAQQPHHHIPNLAPSPDTVRVGPEPVGEN